MVPLKDDPLLRLGYTRTRPHAVLQSPMNHLSLELPRPSPDPNGRLALRSCCRSGRYPAERAPELENRPL
jgi:hypothetical protein